MKTYKLLPCKKTSKGNGVNAPKWEKMKVGNLQGKGGGVQRVGKWGTGSDVMLLE
jgi:hypothetical protein